MRKLKSILLVGLACSLLMGCAGQQAKRDQARLAELRAQESIQPGVHREDFIKRLAADTDPGMEVDDLGTEGVRIRIFAPAPFASGQTEISAAVMPALHNVARALRFHKFTRVGVQAHTDSQGAEDANRALSEKRAQAVGRFLRKSGVHCSRLTLVGRGESQPWVENDTRANRAKNRRIEIYVRSRK